MGATNRVPLIILVAAMLIVPIYGGACSVWDLCFTASYPKIGIGDVPVLIMQPGEVGRLYVRYWPSSYNSSASEPLWAISIGAQGAPSFTITVRPNAVSLAYGTNITAVYRIQVLNEVKGIYRLLMADFCSPVFAAIGFKASDLNASTLPQYMPGLCAPHNLQHTIVAYTGMQVVVVKL